jgi:hypothetical protein
MSENVPLLLSCPFNFGLIALDTVEFAPIDPAMLAEPP